MGRDTISRVELGKTRGSASTVLWLAKTLGIPDQEVAAARNGEDVNEPEQQAKLGGRGVPVVGILNGGPMHETFDGRHSEGGEELPLPLEWFPGCVAAKVRGSSMAPKYNDGDWVILLEVRCEDLQTGWECYIQLSVDEDSGGTLKKIVILDGDELLLLPLNDGVHKPIRTRCSNVRLARRAVAKVVQFVPNFGFEGR